MDLQNSIANKSARVGVIGLGYVGLPLAVEFARAGFPVTGIDIDARKIAALAGGASYIQDVPSADVAALVRAKKFTPTGDFDAARAVDAMFICVPTPFDRMKAPDLNAVISATQSIAPRLRAGQLVILQSTTFPGTTEEVCLPILESGSGLKAGKDFHLAFSPERIDPGATSSAGWSVKNTPKVLGGLTPRCTELAKALLVHLTSEVHVVSSPRAAEMTKLLENIFRSVNIALVNELALLTERMSIDIWEVIAAAKTKPYGFMPFYPGAGVGGHCLSEKEFLFVRNGKGLEGVRVDEYFSKLEQHYPDAVRRIGDVAVLEPEGIQVLSFDLEQRSIGYKPLTALSRRAFKGAMVDLMTADRRYLSVTDAHPMIVWNDTGFCIKRAAELSVGDRLVLPIAFPEAPDFPAEIDLISHLQEDEILKIRVTPQRARFSDHRGQLTRALSALRVNPHEVYRSNRLSLQTYLELERRGEMPIPRREVMLRTGRGPSWNSIVAVIPLNADFARLIGYYLSEGCITKDKSLRTRFTFNSSEHSYIQDVCNTLAALGLRYSKRKDRVWNAVQIKASSNLFARLLRDVLECGTRSTDMQIPGVLFGASASIRQAVLAGLLRGDGNVDLEQRIRHYRYKKKQRTYDHHTNSASVGYFSSSPHLFQQTVALVQSLGLVPTFKKGKPYFRLYGEKQLNRLVPVLDGEKRAALERYAAGRRKQMPTKSFRLHGSFATVPIAEVSKRHGLHTVYSAEVQDTHTFVTSYGIATHNCIPVDPYYLSWKAREFDFVTRFIELAAEVNEGMPHHLVKLTADVLNRAGKPVQNSRVLLLGVAFKSDIDDARNSSAARVIELLLARGAHVQYHDPYVPAFQVGDDVFQRERVAFQSVALTPENLRAQDIVLIVTGHRRQVDYRVVVEHAPLIVDAVNATAGLGYSEKIARVGAPLN